MFFVSSGYQKQGRVWSPVRRHLSVVTMSAAASVRGQNGEEVSPLQLQSAVKCAKLSAFPRIKAVIRPKTCVFCQSIRCTDCARFAKPMRGNTPVTRTLISIRFVSKSGFLFWCGYGGSNPNALPHENLNLACLPIPSYPRRSNGSPTPLFLPDHGGENVPCGPSTIRYNPIEFAQ